MFVRLVVLNKMKNDQSNGAVNGLSESKKKPISDTADIRQRCMDNERVFASFIDLMPARIYLNEDDRQNWLDLVSGGGRKGNVSNEDDEEAANSDDDRRKKKKKDSNDSNGNLNFRINKFDPKYFKTVSQILADMAEHTKRSQQLGMKKLKGLKAKGALKLKVNKDTSIKVANKSQSKKNSGEASKDEAKEKSAPSQAAKRMSKFKEEKRAQIKRQRYDSHCEPQIVDISDETGGEKGVKATKSGTSSNDRKPILNKNGQVVFSKFDFTGDKAASLHNKKKEKDSKVTPATAKPKDYKKLLKQLQEKKEKIEELKQSEPEKAKELETKSKWTAALEKAQGLKTKDDPSLLKKSIKRIEKKKERSRQNWEERKKQVEEKKAKLQEKRRKNLDKKKEKNKDQKMKRLKKKGRVLPGF